MAMAALTTIYWHEVDRPTHANGKKLYHVLWCATAPARVNWYFNNLRVRLALPKKFHSLLGSGSSPNEALNYQINQNLKHNPELYATTLDLQLHIFREGKLCCHHLAMRTPQLRQYEPSVLLAAAAGNDIFSDASWRAWTEQYYTTDGMIAGTHAPPLIQKRKDICTQIKNAPAAVAITKKPAIQKKPTAKKPAATLILPRKKPGFCHSRKRTAFKLVRR